MAELLVRVRDKLESYSDPARAHRRGDVIAICPDGWGWGTKEVSNPEWRIFKLPGVNPEMLRHFEQSEEGPDHKIIRKRALAIDLDDPRIAPLIKDAVVVELPESLAKRLPVVKNAPSVLKG